jgi:hypothetical protein
MLLLTAPEKSVFLARLFLVWPLCLAWLIPMWPLFLAWLLLV